VTHLVALSLSRMASDTVAALAPTLKVGDGAGDASEAQVKALIADFLDDAWARDGLRSGMIAERLSIIDTATCLETGKLTAAAVAKVISNRTTMTAREIMPGEAYFDALPMLYTIDPLIEAATTSQRLAQFQAKLPPPQLPAPSIMGAFMPKLDGAAITHYTAIGRLRLAATALAARMWMVEHEGRAPATLNELVPKYIAAIPFDPLATSDGVTLKYKLSPQPTIAGTKVRPQDRMEIRLAAK